MIKPSLACRGIDAVISRAAEYSQNMQVFSNNGMSLKDRILQLVYTSFINGSKKVLASFL